MSLPDGRVWPFYVVMAKSDTRFFRHPTKQMADEEAQKLTGKENRPFNVLRIVSRFEPQIIPVVSREVGDDESAVNAYNMEVSQ